MLISKKSRRESELFDSRFRNGRGADFALRQYHRCREELSSAFVHLVLLFAFAVLLCFFGRAVWHLFAHHGQYLNPWYRSVVMGMVAVMVASVVMRLWRKYREIVVIRFEIKQFQDLLRHEGKDSSR